MPVKAATAAQLKCCIGCGYCLNGLTEPRCPECGRPFDPNNPATTIPTESCPQRTIRLFTPAKWLVPLAAGATIIAVLLSSIYFLPAAALPILWIFAYLIVALPFLARSWTRSTVIRLYGIDRGLRRVDNRAVRRARKWLGIGFLVMMLRIPFLFLLLLDFPMLIHDAHRLYEREGMLSNYQRTLWPGPLPAEDVLVIPWGVFFDVEGVAVAYCPVSPPPRAVRDSYWHVGGDWYVSTDDSLNVIP